MVQRYGMSDKPGPVSYAADGEVFIGRDYEKSKPYSERVAGDIDDEVKAIIDRAYRRCQEILTDHRDQLEKIAKYLMEFETMDRATFEKAMSEG